MNLSVENHSNFTEIKVCTDKLDERGALALKSELLVTAGKGHKNILLNANGCKECDMAGLSVLLVADRLCKNANGIFVLTGINEEFRHLLQVAHLDKTIRIAEDFSSAEKIIKHEEIA